MKTRNKNYSIDTLWNSYGKVYAGWLVTIVEFADSVTPQHRGACIQEHEAEMMLCLAKVLNDGEQPDTSAAQKKLEEILGWLPTKETILAALNECRKVFESFKTVNEVAFKCKMYKIYNLVEASTGTNLSSFTYEDVDSAIEKFEKDLDSIIKCYEKEDKQVLPTDFIQ